MKAKFVYESINFERGRNVKKSVGVGVESTMNQILSDLQKTSKNPQERYKNTWTLLGYLRDGDDLEKRAVERLLRTKSTELKRVLEFNANSIWDVIFEMDLIKEYISRMPNSYWSYFIHKDPSFKEFLNDVKTPNQRFAGYLESSDTDEILKAVEDGATNLTIGNNKVINSAVDQRNFDLLKKLLELGIDPTTNTHAGERYKRDETNYPLRQAAAKGELDMVELLLAHPKVNPAAGKNFGLKHALRNGHMDVVELLLNNPVVTYHLDELPKTALDKLKKLDLI